MAFDLRGIRLLPKIGHNFLRNVVIFQHEATMAHNFLFIYNLFAKHKDTLLFLTAELSFKSV